jgi:hypothetical protein
VNVSTLARPRSTADPPRDLDVRLVAFDREAAVVQLGRDANMDLSVQRAERVLQRWPRGVAPGGSLTIAPPRESVQTSPR